MPKIEPFEKHTLRYEEWFERNEFVYRSELQAVREHMPKCEKGVEIGVGTGRFAAPLGISVGVEPSSEMGKIAKRRGIEVVGGVAEELPFDNCQLDLVLMVTTICFLDNTAVAFREAYRTLKERGCIVVGFIDKKTPLGEEYQKHKSENVFYELATFYSPDDVVFHMKHAGFRNFSFTQTLFHYTKAARSIEPVEKGYGKGAFVVVKGIK